MADLSDSHRRNSLPDTNRRPSPSTSPTSPPLPPRAAPMGGKTCPIAHVGKATIPHTPHLPHPPMAPLRLDKKEKTLSERPQEAQNLEQQQFIPDAAEEDLVHSLLEKVAERHIS